MHPARPSCRSLRAAPRDLGAAGAVIVLVAASLAAGAPLEREAGACSCVGPHVSVLGPVRVDDVPLNAVVRLEVPSGPAAAVRFVLRAGDGTEASTTSTQVDGGGDVHVVELRPRSPLAPLTRYEIAAIDPSHVPRVTVHAGFTTGSATDTTAPVLVAASITAAAFRNPSADSAACQVEGPWVVVDGLEASDPGRPQAKLLYAVWAPPAGGRLDPRSAPSAIALAENGRIVLGRDSLCSPRAFPFPRTGTLTLGIAAMDEAGNRSAMRTLNVDLRAAKRP